MSAEIPEGVITIDGFPNQWVLPERLVEVEGRQYVRCELHGLIPADHNCSAARCGGCPRTRGDVMSLRSGGSEADHLAPGVCGTDA